MYIKRGRKMNENLPPIRAPFEPRRCRTKEFNSNLTLKDEKGRKLEEDLKGLQEMISELAIKFQQPLSSFIPYSSYESVVDLSPVSRPTPTSFTTSMPSRPAPVVMHLTGSSWNESMLSNDQSHQIQQSHKHSIDIAAEVSSSFITPSMS